MVFISFRDFFFVLALSMHAVFEGLAVGLEGDEEGVWILFTAVCCHKFVMAFCMGVELVRNIESKSFKLIISSKSVKLG